MNYYAEPCIAGLTIELHLVIYKSCNAVFCHLPKSEEVIEDEDFIQLLTRIINLLAPLNIKKDSEELTFLKSK